MTKEEFYFLVETRKSFEFNYKGKNYNMTFEKESGGDTKIFFGQLYEEKSYDSIGEFLNTAKVENHFFKDMMDTI